MIAECWCDPSIHIFYCTMCRFELLCQTAIDRSITCTSHIEVTLVKCSHCITKCLLDKLMDHHIFHPCFSALNSPLPVRRVVQIFHNTYVANGRCTSVMIEDQKYFLYSLIQIMLWLNEIPEWHNHWFMLFYATPTLHKPYTPSLQEFYAFS